MQKGFTLVEIIIVVAIMAISVGFGFTTYTRQIQEQQFKKDVDGFVATARLLREKAIARDLSILPTCDNFIRYYVRISTSTNPDSYRRGFDCSATQTFGDTFMKHTNFIHATTGNPLGDTTISFYPPYGCLNNGCNLSSTIALKNNALNICKNVVFNTLGHITVEETTCP